MIWFKKSETSCKSASVDVVTLNVPNRLWRVTLSHSRSLNTGDLLKVFEIVQVVHWPPAARRGLTERKAKVETASVIFVGLSAKVFYALSSRLARSGPQTTPAPFSKIDDALIQRAAA